MLWEGVGGRGRVGVRGGEGVGREVEGGEEGRKNVEYSELTNLQVMGSEQKYMYM